MKVCIQIDGSFDDFLLKVGKMNNASCGKICRLIVEHQLTFYLNRHVIPSFYPGIFADFKKMDNDLSDRVEGDPGVALSWDEIQAMNGSSELDDNDDEEE